MSTLLIRKLHAIRAKSNGDNGFTLLEAIVVVGILIVLAAVALPNYQGFITEAGKARQDYQSGASAAANSASGLLSSATASANALK